MKDRKGFTLIELLAVLVVLSVILSISVPKFMDVRYESSKKAFKNDVDELQGIAQLEYNNTKEARYYNFKDGVQTNENGEDGKLEFKGDNPGDGYLKIYPNGDIEYELTNKDHTLCASKDVGDRKGQIVKCTESDTDDFTLTIDAKTTTNSIRVIAYPKNGESDVEIDKYYYKLDDGKNITSNKASHLFENLKAEENGKLKDYVIKVKACTKKVVCKTATKTVNLNKLDGISFDYSPKGWSLEKTITFIYPEIKNADGQSIGKNEISTYGGQTFQIYRGSITVDKDTTFVARITDGTNSLESTTITLSQFDHTAPTISGVSGNPSNWTNKDVTLTVNATDSQSGLADAAYSFDGGATWQASASKTYTSNTNGIVIKVRDKVGNISTHSTINITKIDKSTPKCIWSGDTNVAPNAWTRENRSITLTCASPGGSPCNSRYTVVYSTTRKTDTLSYKVTNDAGTSTTCKREFNIYIDKTKPTKPSLSGTNSNWINHDLRIKPSSTDNESGINRYEAYYGGAWHKWSSANYNDLDYFSNERNENVKFRAVDNVGNKSDEIATSVKIDKSNPTCESSGGSPDWTSGSRTLIGICSDSGGSGCRGNATWLINWQGNWSNLSPGKVYDNAGNSTDCPANQTVRIGQVADIEYSIYVGDTNENTVLTENNGSLGGTVGKATPISNMKLKIGATGISGGVSYLAHRQTYGDETSAITEGNKMSTSPHGVKRMEKVKIWLTGDLADAFDIYYRVHVQSFGWLKPVSNGEWTGSSGLCIRIEAIEIQIVPKNSGQPSFNNAGANVSQNVSIISGVRGGPNDRCPKPADPPAPTPNCKTCEYWSTCYDYYYNDSAGSCASRKGKLFNATAFGSGTCRVSRSCKKTYTCCS